MQNAPLAVIKYNDAAHRGPVIELWRTAFGYDAAHNDPELVIDKKIQIDDGLFFTARLNGDVVGTIMAGYDGHRGWIYSLAVRPDQQKQGIGSALLGHAREALRARGCVKVNLQITAGNDAVQEFYKANGFSVEQRISMGEILL